MQILENQTLYVGYQDNLHTYRLEPSLDLQVSLNDHTREATSELQAWVSKVSRYPNVKNYLGGDNLWGFTFKINGTSLII